MKFFDLFGFIRHYLLMECDLLPGASDDQIDKILHKHQVEVARLAEAQEDEKKQQEEHFKVNRLYEHFEICFKNVFKSS